MKKVLVIAGPTASGKTSFSIALAKRLNWDIISGDSVQIYRGMDIGSGKIKEEEKEGVTHYCLDTHDPKERYSVADFQKDARKYIDQANDGIMIVGGTGLYLKAVLYDYQFDEEKENDLSFEEYTNEDLYALLKEKDPAQALKIHPNNRKRVERSLQILLASGQRQSDMIALQNHEMIYDAMIVGCTMERELLYQRIDQRVDGMFEEGLEEEIKQLLDQGVSFEDQSMQAIGYKEWCPYFEGNATIEEVKEKIKTHSHQFAKRQYTWFNHQMPVHWFEVLNEDEKARMIEEIVQWAKN